MKVIHTFAMFLVATLDIDDDFACSHLSIASRCQRWNSKLTPELIPQLIVSTLEGSLVTAKMTDGKHVCSACQSAFTNARRLTEHMLRAFYDPVSGKYSRLCVAHQEQKVKRHSSWAGLY
jgi:hypothetical protein